MSITHAEFSIERNYECTPAHALLFTEQGAFFDDLDQPAEREHGTGRLLDRLGRVLTGESVR